MARSNKKLAPADPMLDDALAKLASDDAVTPAIDPSNDEINLAAMDAIELIAPTNVESLATAMLALPAPTDELRAMVDAETVLSSIDADEIARLTDDRATGDSVSSMITRSSHRYRIGKLAVHIMQSRECGIATVADLVVAAIERRSQRLNQPIPRALADIANWSHALKCWIPGVVASSALMRGDTPAWPSLKKCPFYGLPQWIVDRSIAGTRNLEWGGMICDYVSRIHPSRLTVDVIDSVAAVDRQTARDILKPLLGK